jgi:hypothetical protein
MLRWLGGVIGIVLLGSIAYYGYSAATAERRVTALCAQIPMGQRPESANAFFKAHGFHGTLSDQDGVRYLVEIRTFGRYGCKVTVKNGVIHAAEFNFAD